MKRYTQIIIILLLCAGSLFGQNSYRAGHYQEYFVKNNRIIVKFDSVDISISFLKDNIFRFAISGKDAENESVSEVVYKNALLLDSLKIKSCRNAISISYKKVNLKVNTNPLSIKVVNEKGNTILEGFQEEMVKISGQSVRITFKMQKNDHFYGFGEKCLPFDRRGYKFRMYNTQVYGYRKETSVMSINIPFFINPAGYGLYFDSFKPSFFDLGNSDKDCFYFSANERNLSFYMIIGNSIKKILSNYTWLTGRQPMPPRWAMGYLQSKYGYKNEKEARDIVNSFIKKRIPLSALILDLYWFGGMQKMGALNWDEKLWPGSNSMVEDFLSSGVRTVLIEEPYVNIQSTNFKEADSLSYFGFDKSGSALIDSTWAGQCAVIDMTNPKAAEWWWKKHVPLIKTGIAGWWTDLGEPESNPPEMNYLKGRSCTINNIYNLIWSRTLFKGYESDFPNKRVFMLTRSGFAGMQRWGTFPWSGDVDRSFGGLKCQIPIMLGMGMSGVGFMHSDIGGYVGKPDSELYARWIAFGAFSPIMRAHGVEKGTEPWSFGEETEKIARRYIDIRYKLRPYNYSLAYLNHIKGWPLARPLVFNYPDDEKVLNMSDEYLWGDDFLVAPVLEKGVRTRDVYFPEGEWIDFWSGKIFYGKSTQKVSAPLDKIPVFIRNGAIIPQLYSSSPNKQLNRDTLVVDFYPKGYSKFTLYEDDCETNEYMSGMYATTFFYLKEEVNLVNVYIGPCTGTYSNKPDIRLYLLKIHNVKTKPVFVSVNKGIISKKNKKFAERWIYNSPDKTLKIFISAHSNKSYFIKYCL
ncbi:glycoside hydrolase family 31 protein [bacterium]|nr:glycoside hydrolase family 31 protein [bacterium]